MISSFLTNPHKAQIIQMDHKWRLKWREVFCLLMKILFLDVHSANWYIHSLKCFYRVMFYSYCQSGIWRMETNDHMQYLETALDSDLDMKKRKIPARILKLYVTNKTSQLQGQSLGDSVAGKWGYNHICWARAVSSQSQRIWGIMDVIIWNACILQMYYQIGIGSLVRTCKAYFSITHSSCCTILCVNVSFWLCNCNPSAKHNIVSFMKRTYNFSTVQS